MSVLGRHSFVERPFDSTPDLEALVLSSICVNNTQINSQRLNNTTPSVVHASDANTNPPTADARQS